MEILQWIQKWFNEQCNSDWEHSYGISIETADNPGWVIIIDLNETPWEKLSVDVGTIESSSTDWYYYKIENGKFKAGGDSNKLIFLLEKFRDIVEKC